MQSKNLLTLFSLIVLCLGARASDSLNVSTSSSGWIAVHNWTPGLGWDSLPISEGFDTAGWVAATSPRDQVIGNTGNCSGQYVFPTSGESINMDWWTQTPVPAYDEATFREEFTLNPCAIIDSANTFVEGWADDEMTVYVNGIQIGHTVNGSNTPIQSGPIGMYKSALISALHPGTNVMAVMANDLDPYSYSNLYCVGFAVNAHIAYDAPACTAGLTTIAGISDGNRLMQNSPNPFSQTSIIGYVFSSGDAAYININSMDGRLVKHINISAKGQGIVNVLGSEFSAGAYTCTMYVDGAAVGTNLMMSIGDK